MGLARQLLRRLGSGRMPSNRPEIKQFLAGTSMRRL